MLLNRIILGTVLIVVGYILVWQANWFLTNFGAIPSAEKFMRTEGGSRLFYKLIGIIFILVGSMHMTGLLEPFMVWVVTRLFGFAGFGK